MSEIYNDRHPSVTDDEIDLRELFNVLLDGKWIILSITAFASIFGIIYSLLLPDVYESKAVLAPVDSSNGISGALSSYSGLAGLAGISLSSSNPENNSTKALEKLKSLSFFEKHIMPNIFLPNLMAVKEWNHDINTVVYNDTIYDVKNNKWVRDYSYPNKQIPSAQESFLVFHNGHLNISEDKKTGFITLAVKHQSPNIAKKWVELVISEVNTFYREKDKSESEKAVNYLNEQIKMTNLSEVKESVAELLKNEIQKLTLIEANQSYIFDYIDPPAVMQYKSEPKRSVICIISTLIGGILSIIIVFLIHYAPRERNKNL